MSGNKKRRKSFLTKFGEKIREFLSSLSKKDAEDADLLKKEEQNNLSDDEIIKEIICQFQENTNFVTQYNYILYDGDTNKLLTLHTKIRDELFADVFAIENKTKEKIAEYLKQQNTNYYINKKDKLQKLLNTEEENEKEVIAIKTDKIETNIERINENSGSFLKEDLEEDGSFIFSNPTDKNRFIIEEIARQLLSNSDLINVIKNFDETNDEKIKKIQNKVRDYLKTTFKNFIETTENNFSKEQALKNEIIFYLNPLLSRRDPLLEQHTKDLCKIINSESIDSIENSEPIEKELTPQERLQEQLKNRFNSITSCLAKIFLNQIGEDSTKSLQKIILNLPLIVVQKYIEKKLDLPKFSEFKDTKEIKALDELFKNFHSLLSTNFNIFIKNTIKTTDTENGQNEINKRQKMVNLLILTDDLIEILKIKDASDHAYLNHLNVSESLLKEIIMPKSNQVNEKMLKAMVFQSIENNLEELTQAQIDYHGTKDEEELKIINEKIERLKKKGKGLRQSSLYYLKRKKRWKKSAYDGFPL